jgi:hypothetical protein
MHIPSQRTRHDIDAAAELRAAGATWQTIGEALERHEFVVRRWTHVYREDWELDLAAAERRAAKRGDDDKAKLRALLRHTNARIRRHTADELIRQRRAEASTESPFEQRVYINTFLAGVEQMNDKELDKTIAEFIAKTRRRPEGSAP